MKTCSTCKQEKELEEYRKYSGRSVDGRRPLCKICQRAYEKKWRELNTDYTRNQKQENRVKYNEARKEYDGRYPANNIIYAARQRAYVKGLEFDLDNHRDDLNERVFRGLCEVSGFPLRIGRGSLDYNSPSIDRIDPKKGYVFTNVRVVCFAVNAAMNQWGEAKFVEIMKEWMKKYE